MLPAVRRAFRRPDTVSAGWYRGTVAPRWETDAPGPPTLNLPLQGTYLREVGGRARVVDPSRLVWFAPGEGVRSRPRSDVPVTHEGLYLQLSAGLLAEVTDAWERRPPPSADAPAGPQVVAQVWDAFEAAAHAAPDDAEDALGELFLGLLGPVEAPPPAPRRVRDAQQWLAEDPAGAPGPTGLADALGGSRFALCRQFRAATGRSVSAYREDLRLVRAVQRLRDGEADLAALALSLGFSSHSHFTLRFRRRLGRAPAAVRARR